MDDPRLTAPAAWQHDDRSRWNAALLGLFSLHRQAEVLIASLPDGEPQSLNPQDRRAVEATLGTIAVLRRVAMGLAQTAEGPEPVQPLQVEVAKPFSSWKR